MVRKVFNVWILIVLVALPGCEETSRKPARASIEGIKLADLQPVQFDKFPPQISFNVFTFELLTEKFALIEEMFELLTKQPLNFTSKNAFLANGFEAGFGHPDAWNQVAIRLSQAGAKKVNTHSLLFLDDNPNDVFVELRQTNHVVTYTDSNAKPRKTEVMPGAFVWRIKARSNDQLRGTANVEIQPVFQQNTGGLTAHINEGEQTGAVVFDSASLKLMMGEGDFVLLGPGKDKEDGSILGNIFFTMFGDFVVPDPEQTEAERSKKPNYVLKKGVPLVRLYLIVCTRVEDQ